MHVIQSTTVEGLIAHFNWLNKHLPKYNQENPDEMISISSLSSHYEHLENFKELSTKEDHENWVASEHYNPSRIRGDFLIFYRATFEFSCENERHLDWFYGFLGDCDDFPDNGAYDVTPNMFSGDDIKSFLIMDYKLDKVFKRDYTWTDDVPDPSEKELEAFRHKQEIEKKRMIQRIKDSWK